MARKRIGEVLLERGLISAPQLDVALSHQRRGGGRLGTALVALGALSEGQLTVALGELQGVEVIDLARAVPEWGALHLLRPEFCERHLVLPLALDEERGRRQLTVAVADVLDLPTFDTIEYQTRCKVRPVLAGASQLRAAIARWLRRATPEGPQAAEGSRMLLIRPGGEAELVDTAAVPEDELLIEEAEVLPLEDELGPPMPHAARHRDLDFLLGTPPPREDPLARVERRISGLALLLERKGLCSRQELEQALGMRPSTTGSA